MTLDMNKSKEFQMILKPKYFSNDFNEGTQKIVNMLHTFQNTRGLQFTYDDNSGEQWSRTSDRYDTADHWLAAHSLSCAVEFSSIGDSSRSKLKLKYNVWDESAAYDRDRVNKCIVYPAGKFEDQAKLKLEQDFNARSTKFGLSGSIKIKGSNKVTFARLSDLEDYFKRIDHLENFQSAKPLLVTTSYSETVIDNINLKVGRDGLRLEGALGCRYDSNGTLFKVEFSLKAERPKKGWEFEDQTHLSRLFHAMTQHELHVDPAEMEPKPFPPAIF